MADNKLQNFLLSSIVAPSVTQSDYAARLSDAFNNIDDNFRKLLSVPFLQGADANDFVLEPVKLFETENGENPTVDTPLTSWGKSIVYSILKKGSSSFDDELKTELNKSNACLTSINEYVNSKLDIVPEYSPIMVPDNKFVFATDSLLLTPVIYAYVSRDDAGKITNQFIGQYLRFIDARLAAITPDSTTADFYFAELSCFLSHDRGATADITDAFGSWERIYLTPTIYFNRDEQAWQWSIDGKETGISAQGVKGDEGDPGPKYWIVAIDEPSSSSKSELQVNIKLSSILYVLTTKDNEPAGSIPGWYKVTDTSISKKVESMKSGDLLYVLAFSKGDLSTEPSDMSISTLSRSGESLYCIWDRKLSFEKYLAGIRLSQMLKDIGTSKSDPSGDIVRGLFVKADPAQSDSQTTQEPPLHMFYSLVSSTGEESAFDLHLGMTNSPAIDPMNNDPKLSGGRLVLDSYCLHASQVLLTGKSELCGDVTPETGRDSIQLAEINKLRKGLLNVYGDSYFQGNIDIKLGNAQKFNISGSGEVNISTGVVKMETGNSSMQISASGIDVSVCAGNSEGFDINVKATTNSTPQNVLSTVVFDDIKGPTKKVSAGKDNVFNPQASTKIYGLEIPNISSDTLRNRKLSTQKAKVGSFCYIDGTVKTVDDIIRDFNDLGGFASSSTEKEGITCKIPYQLTWESRNIKVRIIDRGTIGSMISPDNIAGSLSKYSLGNFFSAGSTKYMYLYSKDKNIGLVSNTTVSGSSFEYPDNSKVVDTIKNTICSQYPNIPKSSIKSIEGDVVMIPRTISASAKMNVKVYNSSRSYKVAATPGVSSNATARDVWDNENIRKSDLGKSLTTSWDATGKKSLPAKVIKVGGFSISGDKINYSMTGQIDLSDPKYCVDLGNSARFGTGSTFSDVSEVETVALSGSVTMNVDAYLMATQITYSTSSDKIHMVISPLGIVMKINESGYTDHYFVPGLIDLGTRSKLEDFVSNPRGNSVKSSTGSSSSKSSPTAVKMK